jgi:hypothetical protein
MDLPARRGPGPRTASLVALLAPLPFVVLGALVAAPAAVVSKLNATERSTALSRELGARKLETAAAEIRWVDAPASALGSRRARPRALLRARQPGEGWDVYLVRTRLSPEGTLLGVDGVYDVSRTSAVSEDKLAVLGTHAAWTIGDAERTYRIEMAELGGEPTPGGDDWNRVERTEHSLTNLQQTGQSEGIGRRSFKLDPAARRVSLTLEADKLVIIADEHRIAIPWRAGATIEGERYLREDPHEISRPGSLVTWAVDRARDLSWFGDERMQLTKAIAYRLFDRLDRAVGAVRPESTMDGDVTDRGVASGIAAETNPDTGFPPPAVPPLVTPPLEDEGQWLKLDNDPFVRTTTAVPTPFVTTYLRADGARPDSRVVVVEWDPRQVELDAVPGTEEPQSATGETGSGTIPRKPEVMTRLIGAFNGAFQSTHGDYGMMADGALLVPPKPYAATVARLDDGTTGFGTWPGDVTVPPDVVSFRQNLTPLVADGKFNPYHRDWWGGVPHDWEDETHTVRSGLCLTREGFVAYFYGTQIDHVHLGRAMLAVRCDYGVHLDMNQGHTGLELYRVDRAEKLPPISDKLDGHWQTQGDVLDMPGFRFRGRRLVRNLQLMHFPRFIRRGARDYFYLMLRPLLPAEPLVVGKPEPGEGVWSVQGLPELGWPNALATTSVRPDPARPETKIRVLMLDPTVLRAAAPGESSALVASVEPLTNGSARLDLGPHGASIVSTPREPGATTLATGELDSLPRVAAAVCVDDQGKIVYAEVATAPDPARDGQALATVLDAARCGPRLFLSTPLRIVLGGARDLSDHPAHVTAAAIRLVRRPAPGSQRLFPDTPVLAPEVWQPLQRQTRWFPKDPEPGASSSATASPAASGER